MKLSFDRKHGFATGEIPFIISKVGAGFHETWRDATS
jgi:hypothetical protein